VAGTDSSQLTDLKVRLQAEGAASSVEETSRLANPEDISAILEQPKSVTASAPRDALALHIMGEKLPFLIHKGQTILGRASSSDKAIAVDLSKYYARVLGVSREHAAIRYSATGWTIEDLGSTNGTYLNGTKLAAHQPQALRNGDTVRLGQLTLFVYFK